MKWNPYMNFNGDCEEAFKFYEKCLGGKITAIFKFGETPAAEHVPAQSRHKIMHARMELGDQALMGSDTTPDHPYEGVKGSQIAIQVTDPAKAERVFKELSENGTIVMPLQETFWALRFGMCVDRFGVPWMVNCEAPK
jgi:PhnB protein